MGIMFQPINEVYFGKSKELLDMEKQLDVFRKKYMGRYTLNMKVNSDPDLLKFDRMVENFFGFGCFTIHIVNQPLANGYTVPIDYRYDVVRDKSNLTAVDKTFKFKKKCDYSCLVCSYSGIIFNNAFTTEEVMAMIMHEIGHNFNSFINQKNAVLLNMYTTASTIYFIVSAFTTGVGILGYINYEKNTNQYRVFADKLGKRMRETTPNGLLINFYDLTKQVGSIVKSGYIKLNNINRILSLGSTFFLSAANAVVSKAISIVKNPLVAIFGNPIAYRSERTADNFATMYGYGPASISLQEKLETSAGASAESIMRAADKVPLLSTIMHMVELPGMILLTAFDEHPEGVNRALDQLNMLKYELAKEDIDPKMRKVLESDIAACEDKMKAFVDTKRGIKDPYLARHVYNQYLMSIDGDLKHFFMDQKDKFSQYDDTFDNVVIK